MPIGAPVSSATRARTSRPGGRATLEITFSNLFLSQGVDEVMTISPSTDQVHGTPESETLSSMSVVPGKDVSYSSNERRGKTPRDAIPLESEMRSGFTRHSTAQSTCVSPWFCKLKFTVYGGRDNGTLSCMGDRTYTWRTSETSSRAPAFHWAEQP